MLSAKLVHFPATPAISVHVVKCSLCLVLLQSAPNKTLVIRNNYNLRCKKFLAMTKTLFGPVESVIARLTAHESFILGDFARFVRNCHFSLILFLNIWTWNANDAKNPLWCALSQDCTR